MKEMADICALIFSGSSGIYNVISVVGRFSEDLYKSKRKRFKAALAERPDIQEEYYKKPMNSSQTGGRDQRFPDELCRSGFLIWSSMAATAPKEILGCHH